MTTWTKMELDEIGKAEELQLTPLQIKRQPWKNDNDVGGSRGG